MFDGIGEDVGFALAIFSGILLGANDYCLGAVKAVNTVDDLVKAAHLLDLFGVDVEQILLDGAIRTYSHNDNSSFFVLVAWAINLLQNVAGSTNDGNGAVGWRDKSAFLEVPILGKVFAEGVGV